MLFSSMERNERRNQATNVLDMMRERSKHTVRDFRSSKNTDFYSMDRDNYSDNLEGMRDRVAASFMNRNRRDVHSGDDGHGGGREQEYMGHHSKLTEDSGPGMRRRTSGSAILARNKRAPMDFVDIRDGYVEKRAAVETDENSGSQESMTGVSEELLFERGN